MILSLLLAASVHAAVITDSWLGRAAAPVPVNTQYLKGDTIYLHLKLKLSDTKAISVQWLRNGKLVKTSTIKGDRVQTYSTVSVKALPGEWTVYAVDSTGKRRSHHFVVK